MSESDAAVDRGDDAGDECPVCLEPLPPFWDVERWAKTICCDKVVCKNCNDKQDEFIDRSLAEGSFGSQELQLASTCLCRARRPTGVDIGRTLLDKFEKGELPLHLYYDLAWHFTAGQGVERNVGRGIEILRLGAEKGGPECQHMLGCRYYEGSHGLPRSLEEAKRWYLAATDQGHAIAEYNLALMLSDEGDNAEYLRYMRGSAAKGFDDACFILGEDYYRGECGLEQSFNEAIRVLTPAAERGHAPSMGLLGRCMCQQAKKNNPDFTKGMHWLRRGAEKGDEYAISDLRAMEKYSTICFRCDKWAPPETAFLRCSRCRAAWYCSKDCQVQHWKAKEGGHKQFCIKWKDVEENIVQPSRNKDE